jgi:hypothetical protein
VQLPQRHIAAALGNESTEVGVGLMAAGFAPDQHLNVAGAERAARSWQAIGHGWSIARIGIPAGAVGDHDVASIPEISRMIARIEEWKEAQGKARGRAETDRVLGEAHKLFDDVANMLTETRRELQGKRSPR